MSPDRVKVVVTVCPAVDEAAVDTRVGGGDGRGGGGDDGSEGSEGGGGGEGQSPSKPPATAVILVVTAHTVGDPLPRYRLGPEVVAVLE